MSGRIKAEVYVDADQGARQTYILCCPKCKQKLADVESIRGIVGLRLMCRRCGTYVKADVFGVE